MTAIFANIKIIGAVILAAFIAFLGWHFGDLHGARMATKEVNAQIQVCKKNDELSKGIADDLQGELDSVDDERDSDKRLYACPASTASSAPVKHDAAAQTSKPAKAHGGNIGDFIDFAADAERYRLQLIACQTFVNEERK